MTQPDWVYGSTQWVWNVVWVYNDEDSIEKCFIKKCQGNQV